MKENNIKILNSLAFGIIGLAGLIVIGMLVLTIMGNQIVNCDSGITTETVINETGWINQTGYTLSTAGLLGFTSPTLTELFNRTSKGAVALGNATVSALGVVKNATAIIYNNASISYTYTWNDVHTWNETTQTCLNSTGGDDWTGQGSGFTTITAISTYLGTGSNGLASWIPIIIVLVIGMMFLGYFMNKKTKNS